MVDKQKNTADGSADLPEWAQMAFRALEGDDAASWSADLQRIHESVCRRWRELGADKWRSSTPWQAPESYCSTLSPADYLRRLILESALEAGHAEACYEAKKRALERLDEVNREIPRLAAQLVAALETRQRLTDEEGVTDRPDNGDPCDPLRLWDAFEQVLEGGFSCWRASNWAVVNDFLHEVRAPRSRGPGWVPLLEALAGRKPSKAVYQDPAERMAVKTKSTPASRTTNRMRGIFTEWERNEELPDGLLSGCLSHAQLTTLIAAVVPDVGDLDADSVRRVRTRRS